MKLLRNALLATGIFAVTGATQPGSAEAADCGSAGKIQIAEMTWLSAGMLAHMVDRVAREGYGCASEVVPGDTVPTATSMITKGKPQIAPELWISTAAAIWEKAQKQGGVYKAGDVFTDGPQEGWWIPDYVAAENPGLKSIFDLPKFRDLFVEPASDGKGRLYGCPPGWGCEIVGINLFAALELADKGYEIFSPGSGENLKASIARAVTRKKPILAYYWAPTPVIGKFNLVRLDMGDYYDDRFTCLTDKDCDNPQVTDWKSGEVVVAAVDSIKTDAPDLAEFLAKISLPNDSVNAALAWGDDESASPKEVADHYFKTYESVWTAWMPADVAAKVKASL